MKIIPLSQVENDLLKEVGTKAFSLAQLHQHKFVVPETFIISAEAFFFFLKKNDLMELIESELANVSIEDYHSVDYASRVIHDAILSANFPEELSTKIMQQYKHINAEFVAVRSSLFSEDEHSLPWSGKLETYLRVSPADLLDAVKRCWASLFESEALYQLLRKELKPEEIKIAVVVQRMIDANVSGICYSRHPISHNENELVVEAGIGLGNPTEKRLYTPDTYIIGRDPVKIKEKMIHRQEVSLVADKEEGTIITDLSSKKASQQKINDGLLKELAENVIKIERIFGGPVTVEWLYADQFYYLQVRVDRPHSEELAIG